MTCIIEILATVSYTTRRQAEGRTSVRMHVFLG